MVDEEWAEDTCDRLLPDGSVCGAHIGWGVRWMHLRDCGEHGEGEDEDETDDE